MRSFLAVFLLFLLPALAMAQEHPKAEIFGGYSYVRTEGGLNLHGWNGSVAANVNNWFGIVADFSGQYGEYSEFLTTIDVNLHSFLFGPRFSFRSPSVSGFAHVLAGGTRGGAGVDVFGAGISVNDTGLGLAVGGGLDVRVSDALAVRVFQADYLMVRLLGETGNNARLSAGLVFRIP